MPTSRQTAARRLESITVAADYASVSTKTIRRWIASGNLNGYRAGPRLLRVDLNDVDAMLRPIPTADGGDLDGAHFKRLALKSAQARRSAARDIGGGPDAI